jgi:hypothetical protein
MTVVRPLEVLDEVLDEVIDEVGDVLLDMVVVGALLEVLDDEELVDGLVLELEEFVELELDEGEDRLLDDLDGLLDELDELPDELLDGLLDELDGSPDELLDGLLDELNGLSDELLDGLEEELVVELLFDDAVVEVLLDELELELDDMLVEVLVDVDALVDVPDVPLLCLAISKILQKATWEIANSISPVKF